MLLLLRGLHTIETLDRLNFTKKRYFFNIVLIYIFCVSDSGRLGKVTLNGIKMVCITCSSQLVQAAILKVFVNYVLDNHPIISYYFPLRMLNSAE